jgi:hypothetical protein
LSGGPDTSANNTLANAFVSYCTYRAMTNTSTGTYNTPCEAYLMLNMCCFGGDDGLNMNMMKEAYLKVCGWFGLLPKFTQIKRGDFGVTFLARIYSKEVWNGDTNSCCDLRRQLTKFHTCTPLPSNVTPIEKLVQKSIGYYLTDKHSPIIGPFVTKVVSFSGFDVSSKFQRELRPYTTTDDASEQYPNSPADWMNDYLIDSLPNVDPTRLNNWLDKVIDITELLHPPMIAELNMPVVPQTIVINHETVLSSSPLNEKKKPVVVLVDKVVPMVVDAAPVITITPKVQLPISHQTTRTGQSRRGGLKRSRGRGAH